MGRTPTRSTRCRLAKRSRLTLHAGTTLLAVTTLHAVVARLRREWSPATSCAGREPTRSAPEGLELNGDVSVLASKGLRLGTDNRRSGAGSDTLTPHATPKSRNVGRNYAFSTRPLGAGPPGRSAAGSRGRSPATSCRRSRDRGGCIPRIQPSSGPRPATSR